jgi:hypothetical protein
MVKKYTGWSKILAQDKLIWGNGLYDNHDGKTIKIYITNPLVENL